MSLKSTPITRAVFRFPSEFELPGFFCTHRRVTLTSSVETLWLGQTSSLGRVKPINWSWIRPKGNFSRTKLICLVRRMWRSTFVLQVIFRGSIRLIQTHPDELNLACEARRRTFHEHDSLSLVRPPGGGGYFRSFWVGMCRWDPRELVQLNFATLY